MDNFLLKCDVASLRAPGSRFVAMDLFEGLQSDNLSLSHSGAGPCSPRSQASRSESPHQS